MYVHKRNDNDKIDPRIKPVKIPAGSLFCFFVRESISLESQVKYLNVGMNRFRLIPLRSNEGEHVGSCHSQK
jgi:hypothetical protein